MIHKKYLLTLLTLAIPLSIIMSSIPVQASPLVAMYVKQAMPPGYIPGCAPGGEIGTGGTAFPPVGVEFWIETDIPIVTWEISLQWDPAVIQYTWFYFMEFRYTEGNFLSGYCTSIGWPEGTTFIEGAVDIPGGTINGMICSINKWTALPAEHAGATGTGLMVTLYFTSLSETEYSIIDLVDAECYVYTKTTPNINPDVVGDGHYNTPPNAIFLDLVDPGPTSFPGGDPRGSLWHEIEPVYCRDWELTSWTDNGDGVLSRTDQFDMTPVAGGEVVWYHVEGVNPDGTADDGIPDLFATEKPPVPEFPLGSVAPIALTAAIAYVWWVTKRKRQEAV